MKYTPEVIQAAYSELNNRRQSALTEHDAHVVEISRKLPEIYDIFIDISKTAEKLSAVVFSKAPNIPFLVEKIKNENLKNQEKIKELLSAAGYPENYLLVNYSCKKCSDTGVCLGNRCDCVTELLNKLTIQKLNEQCKIKPHRFSEFRLDYYPETISIKDRSINCRDIMAENLNYCIKYADSFTENSPGLFLFGGTGLGKTFLSSCIAYELLNKGLSVAFDSVQNYLRAIEKEHFGKADGDTMEILLTADLLILDDLGSEFSSSFNDSVIYNLINSRCNMGKPTIVSSNIPLSKLSEKYNDRIISRLTGNFKAIRFLGEDIRQIKRRNEDFQM